MEYNYTYQLDNLEQLSQQLLEVFSSKVIVFQGDMGSGKTTLIKALVKTMGATDVVYSPSFSLVNEYETPQGTVSHFDLYRINDVSEIWDMGFEDYLMPDHWVLIEWPEQILDVLPADYNTIQIKIDNNSSRSLKLTVNNRLLN